MCIKNHTVNIKNLPSSVFLTLLYYYYILYKYKGCKMVEVLTVSNKSSPKKKSYSIESIKNKLDIIKEAILKYVPANTIYLFGSYAYGKPNKNSDIDIYAVIPDNFDKNIFDTLGEIANYIYPYGILNMDLFLVKKSKFLFYTENSSFEESIYNHGIILYERS